MVIAVFHRMRWFEALALIAWPPARRRWEARLRDGIRWLVDHPDVPVRFHD